MSKFNWLHGCCIAAAAILTLYFMSDAKARVLHGSAPALCLMNGIFNLSNTCNNIYLLTGIIR